MLIFKLYYHLIAILKKILYNIIYLDKIIFEKGVTFRKGFSLMIDKNAKVKIGKNTFFNNYCTISSMKKVEIGENCLFAENVKIYDQNHLFKYKNILIKEQGYKKDEIKIGNNCWIASNVVILKGAKIGNNSVISAGEIVNFEVPENSILKNGKISEIKFEEKKE